MSDSGLHPEADLLAAFPRGLLTKAERTRVLSHLAECTCCRQCVMLLSEAESTNDSQTNRRWIPIAGWVSLAAAVALVFSLTLPRGTLLSHAIAPPSAITVKASVQERNNFRHVTLAEPLHFTRGTTFTVHLAGFVPQPDQIVVKSQCGDRWLTIDSLQSALLSDGPLGTVN